MQAHGCKECGVTVELQALRSGLGGGRGGSALSSEKCKGIRAQGLPQAADLGNQAVLHAKSNLKEDNGPPALS